MQVIKSKSWRIKLKETENWFSLYVDWECVSSWVTKEKIKNEVKNSLDEIEQAYLKANPNWKTKEKWIKEAHNKFHDILDRYNNNKDEKVKDFDDWVIDFDKDEDDNFLEKDDKDFDNYEDNDFDELSEIEMNFETVWNFSTDFEEYEPDPVVHYDEFDYQLKCYYDNYREYHNKRIKKDRYEAKKFFDNLIRKWIKLKEEWKNIEEIYEELLEDYNKKSYMMNEFKLYIWIVWFKEIRFYFRNSKNIIYSLFFEENPETKKKKDYSYLYDLLEGDGRWKWIRFFDKEEEEIIVKKIIDKWFKMKEKWEDFENIKKYIASCFKSKWFIFTYYYYDTFWDEINFYKIKEYEDEHIATIEFEEHQETKKEKNYPYLETLIEWNHWYKKIKMVEKEDAEVFVEKLINKWLKLKDEWKEFSYIRKFINNFYETQKDSLNSYNLYIDNKQEGIEFYEIKKDWLRETLAFIELKEINSKEEMEEYVLKMRDKWLKLKEEWKYRYEIYDELMKDYNRQINYFEKNNIYIDDFINSIKIFKVFKIYKGNKEEKIISYIISIPFEK